MALATLSIDLIAQLAKLEQGMDRSYRVAQKAAARIEKEFAGLGKKLNIIFGALGVRQVAQAFDGLLTGVDALNDLRDATGAGIENLSALEDTAARTGTSMETVGTAIVKLNKALADAKPGSQQEQVLKALGLSAQELRNLDPADALVRVAQALGQFEDNGNKARIVQELFGKSLREVAPLLKDLAERGKGVATVTQEQAEEAERYKHAIAGLQKELTDWGRALALEAAPKLREFLTELREGTKAFGGFGSALANLGTETPGPATDKLIRYRDELTETQKKLALLREDVSRGFGSQRAVRGGEQEERRLQRLIQYYERIIGITNVQGGRGSVTPAFVKPSLPDLPEPLKKAETSALERYIQKLKDAQIATLDLSEADRALIAASTGALDVRDDLGRVVRKVTQAEKEYLVSVAAVNDALRETAKVQALADQSVEGRIESTARQMAKLREQLAAGHGNAETLSRALRVLSDQLEALQSNTKRATDKPFVNVQEIASRSRASQIEALSEQLAFVRSQMSSGAGDAETLRRALQVLGEQMGALESNTQGLGERLGQLDEESREVALSMQDAFGASLLSAMEGNAKKIDRIWGDLIKRMVAQAAAARLFQTLFGDFAKTGNVGGYVGRFFSLIGGGDSYGGGGYGAQTPVVDALGKTTGGSNKAWGGVTQNIIVQGDVGQKSMRAMRTIAAESEARMMRRAAY
jgi:hypothetical protein